jgi:hypothetical protein
MTILTVRANLSGCCPYKAENLDNVARQQRRVSQVYELLIVMIGYIEYYKYL